MTVCRKTYIAGDTSAIFCEATLIDEVICVMARYGDLSYPWECIM